MKPKRGETITAGGRDGMNVSPPGGSGPLSVTMPLVPSPDPGTRNPISVEGTTCPVCASSPTLTPLTVAGLNSRGARGRIPAIEHERRADQAVRQPVRFDVPETNAEIKREV